MRHPELSAAADIAVAVVDEWPGRGVGRTMLSLLCERATDVEFERSRSPVLATNRPMLGLQ